MAKDKIINKLDLFLDGGIRYYFSRVFWSDYSLKRDIELAGYLSEIKKLDEEIKVLEKPSENDDGEYSDLVTRLNSYAKDEASGQNLETWNEIKKDTLKYFDCGLPLSKDIGKHNKNKEGYVLNTSSGELSYWNKEGKHAEICTFGKEEMEEVAWRFPDLFAEEGMLDKAFDRQLSMKLSPGNFASLVELAQKKNPRAQFWMKAGKKFVADSSFVQLFRRLRRRMWLFTKREGRVGSLSAEHLIKNTVEHMDAKITLYLNDSNLNTDRRAILEAIQDYLKSGDDKVLSKAVLDHDKRWFKSLYLGETYKILKTVEQLRESHFFKQTIKAISESKDASEKQAAQSREVEEERRNLRDNAEKPYEYIVINDSIQDVRAHERKIGAYWAPYIVRPQAFKESLEKMKQYLVDTATRVGETLPEVSLPVELLSQENGESKKQTVIDHIVAMIDCSITKSTAANSREQFQTQCASLQNDINRILNVRSQEDKAGFRLIGEVQTIYNEIGDSVTKTLTGTDKEPKKDREIFVAVEDVRKEIYRLQAFNNEIINQLSDFQRALVAIGQDDFSNDIQIYRQGPLKDRQEVLTKLLADIKGCEVDKFNLRKPVNDGQLSVVNTISTLIDHGKALIENLSVVMLHPDEKSAKDDIPRAFKSTNRRSEKEDSAAFSKIMEKIKGFLDKLSPDAEANIPMTESPEIRAASPASELTFFKGVVRSTDLTDNVTQRPEL